MKVMCMVAMWCAGYTVVKGNIARVIWRQGRYGEAVLGVVCIYVLRLVRFYFTMDYGK